MRVLTMLLLLLFLPATIVADCVSDEMSLFPVNAYGRGANGSSWSFAAILLNLSDQDVTTSGVVFAVLCPIPEGCFSKTAPSGSFAAVTSPIGTNGFVIRLPAAQAEQVVPSLRLYELSSRSTLEVPTPRSKDFRTGALWLPSVSIDLANRTAVRIYQPDGRELAVRLSVYSYSNVRGEPQASATVTIPSPNVTPDLICAVPSSATITLQNQFPEVARTNGVVNVLIEPVGPVERFWAFASVTDNKTNRVHIVSPQ